MTKLVLRTLCFLGVLLASMACKTGLPAFYAVPAYGVPPPPEHPTVRLTDFSYTPASPIHIGDSLTLTARTNIPIAEAGVVVELPASVVTEVRPADDGKPPDTAAGDGIWTAETTWTAEMGPVDQGAIYAVLIFDDYYANQTLTEPITVLPEED